MKFTKKEISNIKHYFFIIKQRLEIHKIYEKNIKKHYPEFVKLNLIKYGFYAGRIIEIIYRRINFKDEEKNLNADELIKELFGEDFFNWVCNDHKEFTHGINTPISERSIDNISING